MNVIFRGDDFGSAKVANYAISSAVAFGILRNVSVMVPGPAFESGVHLIRQNREAGAAIGLHIVLNAEWVGVKWGPISQDVPTLTEPEGWFTRTPNILHERGFSLDEAEREIRAQYARMADHGVAPDYIDEHMGVAWLPGLRERVERVAEDYGLIYRPNLDYIPAGDKFWDRIEEIELGACITHPALPDNETEAWWHEGLEPGQVANERFDDYAFLTDPSVRDRLKELCVRSITYKELA